MYNFLFLSYIEVKRRRKNSLLERSIFPIVLTINTLNLDFPSGAAKSKTSVMILGFFFSLSFDMIEMLKEVLEQLRHHNRLSCIDVISSSTSFGFIPRLPLMSS